MTEPRSVATTDTHDAVGNLVRDIKGSTKKPSAYDADDRLRDIKVGKAGGAWAFMATLGSGGVRTLGLPTVHDGIERRRTDYLELARAFPPDLPVVRRL